MAGEYGVNIKFRTIGLTQLDKAKAKAKELENSVSKQKIFLVWNKKDCLVWKKGNCLVWNKKDFLVWNKEDSCVSNRRNSSGSEKRNSPILNKNFLFRTKQNSFVANRRESLVPNRRKSLHAAVCKPKTKYKRSYGIDRSKLNKSYGFFRFSFFAFLRPPSVMHG